jgi:hypothetical protein
MELPDEGSTLRTSFGRTVEVGRQFAGWHYRAEVKVRIITKTRRPGAFKRQLVAARGTNAP